MPNFDTRCTSCVWTGEIILRVGDPLPVCPTCQQPTEKYWAASNRRYSQDDIPGGLTLHNLGHHPVTVYSHSERLRIMKERGLREAVFHVEGDKHATNWDVGSSRGQDALPACFLSPEDQEKRHAEWLASEPK